MSKGALGITTVFAALAIFASPANASHAAPPDVPGICGEPAFEQPFSDWYDRGWYALAPGGDFEDGAAGWTLDGGAALVADGDDTALELPPGATATSPPLCVGAGYTHARMFNRSGGSDEGHGWSKADVAVYHGAAATGEPVRERTMLAWRTWNPTWPVALGERDFLLDPATGTAEVTITFTATGGNPFVLDDVYVDPSRRN